uniref:Integrase catalytic domain-containing protein n=2 Tax=Strongyloides stercoralis TaxID=6248 RepID=A0AAF5DJ77_STRER
MQFELRRLYDKCDFCQQARKKARRVYGTWNASKARQNVHGDILMHSAHSSFCIHSKFKTVSTTVFLQFRVVLKFDSKIHKIKDKFLKIECIYKNNYKLLKFLFLRKKTIHFLTSKKRIYIQQFLYVSHIDLFMGSNLKNISSKSVKRALHQFELDFGKPDTYIFDQGTQFQGLHDISSKILVPANSQHANGVCERQVQRLKKCLMRNQDIKPELAISLYLSQARFEKTFGASAAEKLFGLELSRILPFTVETNKMKMLSRFQPNEVVYAFFKTGIRWRKAKIIKCMGSKVFQLQLVDGNENGKLFSRHINELRR